MQRMVYVAVTHSPAVLFCVEMERNRLIVSLSSQPQVPNCELVIRAVKQRRQFPGLSDCLSAAPSRIPGWDLLLDGVNEHKASRASL